jgi:flagellar hook-associated protein 3 FlgL
MASSAMRQLQTNLSELARLQEQATSQRAFLSMSDDPAAATTALRLHGDQHRNEQYARNIGDGLAWLITADSAITAGTSLLGRVRTLTLQGANDGALDATAKEAIAVELESIRDEMLSTANTTVAGRSVFAGTSDTAAFAADYSFSGIPGSEVVRQISDAGSIRVDSDGEAVFGAGANSVFALIDDIVADLRSGVNVGVRVGEIDQRRNAMLSAQGTVGARQAQIERAKEATLQDAVSLEARRAAVEDVDSVEVLVQLQAQELVYRTALAVTGRVLQPSLMDFLR